MDLIAHKTCRARRSLAAAAIGGLAALLIAISVSGCGVDVKADLNAAVDQLSQQSAAWQSTLLTLEDRLRTDATAVAQQILPQVQDLVNGSIAAAGDEFRCNADFIGTRARQSLINIAAVFFPHDFHAAPVPPTLCHVVPDNIDTRRIRDGSLTTVQMHGYDLAIGTVHAQLLNSDGSTTPEPDYYLGTPTRYEMTVNVASGNGMRIPASAQKLQLLTAGRVFDDITISQPAPPVTVSSLAIRFHTNDENKYNDTGVGVTVAGGRAVWTQATPQEYPPGSDVIWGLSPSTLYLSDLSDAPLQICITPNGHDTWRFNWTLTGSRSDGQPYQASQAGVDLDQDHRCGSWTLPRFATPAPQAHHGPPRPPL